MKICPSIASGDVLHIAEQCKLLEETYGHIHIDIEDGNFIPNITFGMKMLKAICAISKCEISVHLMVSNPLLYLEEICEASPSLVFFHPDAVRYPSMVIDAYQKAGINIGIALNPSIELGVYSYCNTKVKDILIMTAEPDGYEQCYIPEMEDKIKRATLIYPRVYVDGAITWEKVKTNEEIGVFAAVMGRAVFEKLKK